MPKNCVSSCHNLTLWIQQKNTLHKRGELLKLTKLKAKLMATGLAKPCVHTHRY